MGAAYIWLLNRSTRPELILLDIRLPGIDGFEVCRLLKADERTRSIPIIFISALEDEREKVQGFQTGALDYITKPFKAEKVAARVRNHLHLRELKMVELSRYQTITWPSSRPERHKEPYKMGINGQVIL